MEEEQKYVLEKVGCMTEFWENYQDQIIKFGKAILLTLIVMLLAWLVCKLLKKTLTRAFRNVPQVDEAVCKVLVSIFRVLIWVIACLIILDLFGVNTASILTVLGAAGLAIGLAMKDSLSNIAAGLMLLILRPYKLGDYVDCGSVSGTIKDMGLFTTTLETFDGIFVSVPNNAVFGSPVKNYSRNPMRRADIVIGIAYGDSLPKAMEVLNAFLKENEFILQNPAPEVLVADMQNGVINLNLRFWTNSNQYWDGYWSVKKGLKPVLESAGLTIPIPHRAVKFINEPMDTEKE